MSTAKSHGQLRGVDLWRNARIWWVCVLMFCIPLQGMAMVMERIHGAAHVHVAAGSVRPPLSVLSLPAGMPQLLSVNELRHSHGAVRSSSVDLRADMGPAVATSDRSSHPHDRVGHHRHGPDDPTVLSVDDAAADADAANVASKRLLLDVDTLPTAASPQAGTALTAATPDATAARPGTPGGGRMERPPRPSRR